MADEELFDRDGIGGNSPPSSAETAVAALKADLAELGPRKVQIISALRSVVVRDRATAGAATDTIGIAIDVGKEVERRRMDVTRPLDTAIKAAIATATNFWDEVLALIGDGDLPANHPRNEGTAFGALISWKAAENQRRLDQEAEQRSEEDRLRREAARSRPVASEPHRSVDPFGATVDAPTQPISEEGRRRLTYDEPARPAVDAIAPTREPGVEVGAPATSEIRGEYGYVARKKKKFDVEVIDVSLVPRDILNSVKVKEAICAVAKGRAIEQGGGEIPGLKIKEIVGTRVQ